MAYNEALAERIRQILAGEPATERKMFGGIAFMIGGNMLVGVTRDDLMVRVGAAAHEDSLARPHARPMDFTGRPMKGMVYVGPEGYASDVDLHGWVKRGLSHARALPPKK